MRERNVIGVSDTNVSPRHHRVQNVVGPDRVPCRGGFRGWGGSAEGDGKRGPSRTRTAHAAPADITVGRGREDSGSSGDIALRHDRRGIGLVGLINQRSAYARAECCRTRSGLLRCLPRQDEIIVDCAGYRSKVGDDSGGERCGIASSMSVNRSCALQLYDLRLRRSRSYEARGNGDGNLSTDRNKGKGITRWRVRPGK